MDEEAIKSTLEWWAKWQLRILALESLFIQCFLFFSAPFRKRQIPALLRFFIWLAYLGSDAVAIYALATLFNRHRDGCDGEQQRPTPEILWAPILLVHLGGQEGITAYNIEDNELWRRHVITAVSQVAVAFYVFAKYPWPTNNGSSEVGTFTAGLLVFVSGIAKCAFKPWDLKRVSINSLVDESPGCPDENNDGGGAEINSLHEYIREGNQYFHAADDEGGHGSYAAADTCKLADEVWKPYNLCVDLAPPYSGRLSCLKHVARSQGRAHGLVRSGLSAMFHRLYTKESLDLHNIESVGLTAHNPAMNRWKVLTSSVGLRAVAGVLLVAAIALFHTTSASADYDKADVTVTDVLLWGTFVLECVMPTVIHHTFATIKRWFEARRWPDRAAQCSLVGYVARSRRHRWLVTVAAWVACKDLLDQRLCEKQPKPSLDITKLVHGHLARGWTEGRIADAESFRAFNDYRGQLALGTIISQSSRRLRPSVSRPFDESVLLWHLATDMCFHHRLPPSPSDEAAAARRCSREMSNYMAHLLLVNPEMLMPGARRSIFRAAQGELVGLLEEIRPASTPRDERGLINKVVEMVKRDPNPNGGGIVREAWGVAEELMALHGMWVAVQGVWVEMLCFSAGRCRGYLHAKNLGSGGEYLSYVWLLLLYMGMETLADKMQRTELDHGAGAGAGAGRTSSAAAAIMSSSITHLNV